MVERSKVKVEDTWDLSSLYTNDILWQKDFDYLNEFSNKESEYKGKLSKGVDTIIEYLKEEDEISLCFEKVLYYAFLQESTDSLNPDYAKRLGMVNILGSKLEAKASFFRPELLSIDDKIIKALLNDKRSEDYKVKLNKMLRFKDYTLSEKEEALLAKASSLWNFPSQSFSYLENADMKFGKIDDEDLTHASFARFLHSKDRSKRERAYKQYYENFDNHKFTISSLLSSSVSQDVYLAKVRGYDSAVAKALYNDDVDLNVYKNLVSTINKNLPSLHKYYELKRKVLKLDKLAHYDVYAPLSDDNVKSKIPYERAAEIVIEATKILGQEYTCALSKGLLEDRWVDKYENKGKRSGAFSAGSFVGNPYILISYDEDNIRSLLTLAHEAGHSMHSYFSSKNNPFSSYNYTIFEAEVASTFNEQLIANYLNEKYKDDKDMMIYLTSSKLDDIVATLFRQTMFAEFELVIHDLVEKEEILSESVLRSEYRKLLEKYFGKDVELFDISDLEGLRIPHFYNAFYVYKYSTGISAAIALSQKVLKAEKNAKENYLNFLKSGGSKFPIESLKLAGVDMSKPEPIQMAIDYFNSLVEKMENLLK